MVVFGILGVASGLFLTNCDAVNAQYVLVRCGDVFDLINVSIDEDVLCFTYRLKRYVFEIPSGTRSNHTNGGSQWCEPRSDLNRRSNFFRSLSAYGGFRATQVEYAVDVGQLSRVVEAGGVTHSEVSRSGPNLLQIPVQSFRTYVHNGFVFPIYGPSMITLGMNQRDGECYYASGGVAQRIYKIVLNLVDFSSPWCASAKQPVVPCDMLLVRGSCVVDESNLTGDPVPVPKRPPLPLQHQPPVSTAFMTQSNHLGDDVEQGLES